MVIVATFRIVYHQKVPNMLEIVHDFTFEAPVLEILFKLVEGSSITNARLRKEAVHCVLLRDCEMLLHMALI